MAATILSTCAGDESVPEVSEKSSAWSQVYDM